jgi:hypothetical protein
MTAMPLRALNLSVASPVAGLPVRAPSILRLPNSKSIAVTAELTVMRTSIPVSLVRGSSAAAEVVRSGEPLLTGSFAPRDRLSA